MQTCAKLVAQLSFFILEKTAIHKSIKAYTVSKWWASMGLLPRIWTFCNITQKIKFNAKYYILIIYAFVSTKVQK